MRTKIWLLLSLFLISACVNQKLTRNDDRLIKGSSTATKNSSDKKDLRVCALSSNAPFSSRDGSGFENKLAQYVAQTLDMKLIFVWHEHKPSFIKETLLANACDLVMGLPTDFKSVTLTIPYMKSPYVLLYAKGGLLNSLNKSSDIDRLPENVRKHLRVTGFDGSPGTNWWVKHGLKDQLIPYTGAGSSSEEIAMFVTQNFLAKNIDGVILWGPIAKLAKSSDTGLIRAINLTSEPNLILDYELAMAVRPEDSQLAETLNSFIRANQSDIDKILISSGVPLSNRSFTQPIPTSSLDKDRSSTDKELEKAKSDCSQLFRILNPCPTNPN